MNPLAPLLIGAGLYLLFKKKKGGNDADSSDRHDGAADRSTDQQLRAGEENHRSVSVAENSEEDSAVTNSPQTNGDSNETSAIEVGNSTDDGSGFGDSVPSEHGAAETGSRSDATDETSVSDSQEENEPSEQVETQTDKEIEK